MVGGQLGMYLNGMRGGMVQIGPLLANLTGRSTVKPRYNETASAGHRICYSAISVIAN
jgi:hypothetical protein